MAGRSDMLRAALRRIFSSLPEEVTETEARRALLRQLQQKRNGRQV